MIFEIEGEKYVMVTTITNPQTKKDYIIYKKKDSKELLASRYQIIDNNPQLSPIENDAEYDFIDEQLQIIKEGNYGNN